MMNFDLFTEILHTGGIVAYPTEAVFGLGCNPFNERAVRRLLAIKNRPTTCGLIIVADNWNACAHLTQPLAPHILQPAFDSWPGPHTWVFPASSEAPTWICAPDHTIAIRIPKHPTVHALCKALGMPLVSTSANRHQHPPAKTAEAVQILFGDQIDAIVPGEIGHATQPSSIRHIITQKIIR